MKLITGGCSFTETESIRAWPLPLSEMLGADLTNVGLSCQGNGLIAKRVIHALTELKSYKNTLVGVMWSGVNRGEQFTTNKVIHQAYQKKNIDGWQHNPVTFPKNSQGGWLIHNVHWTNVYSRDFYRRHDNIGAQIDTLHNIIYLQSFLKANKIKFFMSNFTAETFSYRDTPDVDYLYKLIDWNHFLPVEGCHEWCRDNSTHPFCSDGWHPGEGQYVDFTEQVILPFIKTKYNIDKTD